MATFAEQKLELEKREAERERLNRLSAENDYRGVLLRAAARGDRDDVTDTKDANRLMELCERLQLTAERVVGDLGVVAEAYDLFGRDKDLDKLVATKLKAQVAHRRLANELAALANSIDYARAISQVYKNQHLVLADDEQRFRDLVKQVAEAEAAANAALTAHHAADQALDRFTRLAEKHPNLIKKDEISAAHAARK